MFRERRVTKTLQYFTSLGVVGCFVKSPAGVCKHVFHELILFGQLTICYALRVRFRNAGH